MNYLITFHTASTPSEGVHETIRGLGDFGLVTPYSYVVQCNLKAAEIIELLQKELGPNDDVGVFAVGQPWASYCDLIVQDFLVATLGNFEDWTPRDYERESKDGEVTP